MSVSASISVQLERRNNEKISVIQLINTFISNNWRLQDDGKISYLPLGDDDDFDWQYNEISVEELMNIVNKKEICREIIGLLMLWDTTDVGVQLLIHSELELSFSISVNRKTIDNGNITDVNWYLEKIITLLKKNNYIIESFSFEEYC
ncbi:hypothetical protein [Inconstantimicrobium mannanitabidum]|uniref:hypothetical protein n=1 Tax=Inconstantimicrobium mannanitabidum TaxID=1604901 RepID=UPI0021C2E214|nr:hypothetical protein [Clostridium sp. TW13]